MRGDSDLFEPDITGPEPSQHGWLIGAAIMASLVIAVVVSVAVLLNNSLGVFDKAFPLDRSTILTSHSPKGTRTVRIESVQAGGAASADAYWLVEGDDEGRPLISWSARDPAKPWDHPIEWLDERTIRLGDQVIDVRNGDILE